MSCVKKLTENLFKKQGKTLLFHQNLDVYVMISYKATENAILTTMLNLNAVLKCALKANNQLGPIGLTVMILQETEITRLSLIL